MELSKIFNKKNLSLFAFGGVVYGLIEILWRGRTHWSMILTGGAGFLSLFKIFGKIKDASLVKKCVLGSSVITTVEFISGCIFNLLLKMDVWDYSKMPLNFKGQVCALYSCLWGLLCIPISIVCKEFNKN